MLDLRRSEQIGFIPWYPLATGKLAATGGPLDQLSQLTGHTRSQLALAWLLQRSPLMLPIPGTQSLSHLAENCAAGDLDLEVSVVAELNAPGPRY